MDPKAGALNSRAVVRLLAGLCVALALMCLGLALAYARKSEQVQCYADAAELGLTPPGSCERDP